MSSEHYISHAVLKLIGDEISVAGLVMSDPGESKTISSQRLTANVLCKTHNEMLSPLDRVAKNLFETAHGFIRSFAMNPGESHGRLHLMNGNDVEYLMLKMMCGLTASRAVRGLSSPKLNQHWLAILSGRSPWPHKWGLYIEQQRGNFTAKLHELRIGLRVDEENAPVQLGIRFAGWHWVLHASEKLAAPTSSQFRYRPDLLVSQRGSRKFGIAFTYRRGDTDGGFVRQTIHDAQVE